MQPTVPVKPVSKTADKPRRHRSVEVRFPPSDLFTAEQARELGFELLPPDHDDLVTGQLRDSIAAHQPLIALKEALASDRAFKDRVAVIRLADSSKWEAAVDRAARAYAWNGGRPLAVMRQVFARCAAGTSSYLESSILNFPPVPSADLDAPSVAPRWKKGGDWRGAADKLARLGAGRCLAAGCQTTIDVSGAPQRARVRYCAVHSSGKLTSSGAVAPSHRELWVGSDKESISSLLRSVGSLLGQ